MQRIHRYLASCVVGAALISPVAIQARFNPAGDEHHDRDDRARRYYDRDHRDYHRWDAREDAAYRHWLMEERREQRFRDYARLRREEQVEYWRWRHGHPDWR